MRVEPGRWLKLNPATLAVLPEAAGIYEIANLVRSVLYVAPGAGNVRRAVAGLGPLPPRLPASIGGYYVRFALTPDEESAIAEYERTYRARHAGHLPVGNESPAAEPLRVLTRRAA